MTKIFLIIATLLSYFAGLSAGGTECGQVTAKLASGPARVEPLWGQAEQLERRGNVAEAKKARLLLAKSVAKKNGVEWPSNLSDEKAADLIWAAHTLPPAPREAGFAGLRKYFGRYLFSGRPELAEYKRAFGPVLAKELLRRGVCGDETQLLEAVAQNPLERTPQLILADFLDEHDRPASAETLRLRAALDETPPTRENQAEIGRLKVKLNELALSALKEWQDSETGQRLAALGNFNAIGITGLPILRPRGFNELLEAPPDLRRLIKGLDLRRMGLHPEAMETFATLEWENVATLLLAENHLGTTGAQWLSSPSSTFKNVRHLDLSSNHLDSEAAWALGSKDSPFKNVTVLHLGSNELGDEGVGLLARSHSPFHNVTDLNLSRNGIIPGFFSNYLSRSSPFQKVTKLDLSSNPIGNLGFSHLHAVTSPLLRKVSELSLRDCQLGSLSTRALFMRAEDQKNGSPHLHSLDLGENNFGSLGVETVHSSFLPKIQYLDLGRLTQSERIVRELLSASDEKGTYREFGQLRELTTLRIQPFGLTAATARLLANRKAVVKNIETVIIGDTPITPGEDYEVILRVIEGR